MRILHVISRMDPSDGGPPMALSRLAAAQVESGVQVTVAALEQVAERSAMLTAYQNIPGFHQVALRYLSSGCMLERLLAREAAGQLRLLIDANDLIHIHGIWRPHLLQATRVARAGGRPYAISPHGMLSTWSMAQKSFKKRAALCWGWRTALDKAAFVHVLNHDESQAVSLVCNPQRMVTLPNGVNLAEVAWQSEWDTVWQRFPVLQDTRYVVFVGRLHHSKGLDVLASAFASVVGQVPDVHLVVMGPEFGAGESFRHQIRSLGIESRVHVLGAVYGTDKVALLRHAQCFCLPSRQEGFSMAILEAMALGLPVVITESCHFPEVAEAEAGEVVPFDSRRVAAALVRLLQDDAFRTRCGAAARDLTHTRYQWAAIAQTFLEAYKQAGARSLAHSQKAA
jgi:glycosyltransferase involved in cell wall biosynthesis